MLLQPAGRSAACGHVARSAASPLLAARRAPWRAAGGASIMPSSVAACRASMGLAMPAPTGHCDGLHGCSSSSSAASASSASSSARDVEVVAFAIRCRNTFLVVAACAAWAYLSCSSPSGSPFASMAVASGAPSQSSFAGLQSAVRSAWTGLAAGVLHTLCGPDHLAALTPLTIGRNRVAASALGALWGFGHSTGQLILGLTMVLLKERFHDFLPALERWSGTVVALTLIAIGAMGIYESHFASDAAEHAEEEQEAMKMALAGGGAAGGAAAVAGPKAGAGFATYATGIVYGLQPDALFVVVPALALPTKAAAVAYCSMFVIGTVLAMGGYTLVIGTTSAALTKQRPWLQAHLSTVASVLAIVVGVFIGLGGAGIGPFMS